MSDYLVPALRDSDAGVRRLAIIGVAESRRLWGPLSSMDDAGLASTMVLIMRTDPSERVQLTAANYLEVLAGLVTDGVLRNEMARAVAEYEADRDI